MWESVHKSHTWPHHLWNENQNLYLPEDLEENALMFVNCSWCLAHSRCPGNASCCGRILSSLIRYPEFQSWVLKSSPALSWLGRPMLTLLLSNPPSSSDISATYQSRNQRAQDSLPRYHVMACFEVGLLSRWECTELSPKHSTSHPDVADHGTSQVLIITVPAFA